MSESERDRSERAKNLADMFAAFDALPEKAQDRLREVARGERAETPLDNTLIALGRVKVDLDREAAQKSKRRRGGKKK